ncbi:hypothetical protein GCM10010149_13950 [Nonomuraea roseoviolacea subsp. roseoviolacea]|uniref:DUF1269 domain-containing protein n=1 Tax=Nonomuraea roseoviolacea TaxID=103837 RepID=UPI0031D149F4
MRDLIAIAYPDRAAAELAERHAREADAEGALQVEDLVVMTRDEDGTVQVRQGGPGVGMAVTGGAVWGGVIGLLLLAPLFGMAVGAVAGGVIWKSAFGDAGVTREFVDELRQGLPPGGAALILLVRDLEPEGVLPRLRQHGRLIRTSLGPEAEAQLAAALAAARPERPRA